MPDNLTIKHIQPPQSRTQRYLMMLFRGLLKTTFRPVMGHPFPASFQRKMTTLLSVPMLKGTGASHQATQINGIKLHKIEPTAELNEAGAILFIHGGAFCVGNYFSHRTLTHRLAAFSKLSVYAPDNRLAPEHPSPAALDDIYACFQHLLEHEGYQPQQIVIAGDSAGGYLTLALAQRLLENQQLPAGVMLISSLIDLQLQGDTLSSNAKVDPMLHMGWIKQAMAWANIQQQVTFLEQDWTGLPPTLIQVGELEMLFDDSRSIGAHLAACGVTTELNIYQGGWHDFHLQAQYLTRSREAIERLAEFARQRVSG